jgi:hypothetical protein
MSQQTDPGLLMQDLVYAGLEVLRTAVDAELCAYLHASDEHGPQLYLAAPDLGSTDPTEAFNLFTSFRDALDDEHAGDETFLIGTYVAVAVTTVGARSRGLHVVGRREAPLEASERELVAKMARALGAVVHNWQPPPDAPPEPAVVVGGARLSRVAIETVEGRARAEVSASLGDEVRTGVGEAASPSHAVTHAVCDLVGGNLKLVETADENVAGDRITLVLLKDEIDRRAIGASLVSETNDLLQATAIAALDAATRLTL